jgi:D-glycero-D-manno-heptose 1,7-bisphosphate phosphatase
VLVTNQSGIGRGYFTEADFRAVQARMEALLVEHGARIDAVYHCPHGPDEEPPCRCRKPEPGLFLRAAHDLGLDPARSFYIGDRGRDLAAAALLGGTPILVRAGIGEGGAGEPVPEGTRVVDTLEHAVRIVLADRLPD